MTGLLFGIGKTAACLLKQILEADQIMPNINSRTRLVKLSMVVATLLLSGFLIGGGLSTQASPNQQAGNKLVLAFYYMWFSPADFGRGQMSDAPIAPYNSSDPAVIELQIRDAKSAGIDGFIAAWDGAGTQTDKNFATLLDKAAGQGSKAALHFETSTIAAGRDVAAQIKSGMSLYGSNAAYLHWNNRPIIFFWSPQTVGNSAAWRSLRAEVDPGNSEIWLADTTDASYLDTFDGIYLFSAGKWTASTNVAQVEAQWRGNIDGYNKAHDTSRLWAAGIMPGWDESHIQPPRNPAKVFPRRDGAEYETNWSAAVASKPDLITITSYNEWYEGTQIEPSLGAGTKYLDITRKQSGIWKNGTNSCSGGTFFKETSLAICKQMESYWQKYGGLAQFGYPISISRSEKSSTDSKTYTVQYFERAVFELHPENTGTPYEVQVSLLGRRFHKVDPPEHQIVDSNMQFFKETGHNVIIEFAQYWQAHGGLFVNGYPTSELFTERASDGKTYRVQYFERARFELHPENATPYNILLGQLGRQALTP